MKSILLALIIFVFLLLIPTITQIKGYIAVGDYYNSPVSLQDIFSYKGGELVGIFVVLVTLILFYNKFKWEDDFLYLLSSMTFKKVSKVFNSTKEKIKKELEDE